MRNTHTNPKDNTKKRYKNKHKKEVDSKFIYRIIKRAQKDKKKVIIKNRIIKGCLDLSNIQDKALKVHFLECIFSENSSIITSKDGKPQQPSINIEGGVLSSLTIEGCTIKNGINLEHIKITGNLSLIRNEFLGPVWLPNMNIGGIFRMKKCKFLYREKGGVDIRSSYIGRYITIRNCIFWNQIYFGATQTKGQINIIECIIRSQNKNAIFAQRIMCRGAFFIKRTKIQGEIHIVGGELGGIYIEDSEIIPRNSGITIDGRNLRINGDCKFLKGFISYGKINLDRSNISGEINMGSGLFYGNKEKNWICISLKEVKSSRIIMPKDYKLHKRGFHGIIDLTRAKTDVFEDYKNGWITKPEKNKYIIIDGFTYNHLLNPTGDDNSNINDEIEIANIRKKWLFGQKEEHLSTQFKSQPWVQIINTLNTSGHKEAAKELYIIYRRHYRKSTMNGIKRFLDYILEKLSGYGYKPWRSVVYSLVFITLFSVIWWNAYLYCTDSGCHDETVFIRSDISSYSISLGNSNKYPDFNPIGFSFDSFIPVFDFGYQESWSINTSWAPICKNTKNIFCELITIGGILYIIYIVEVILGAILFTLIIAGFTGLIQHIK